MGYQPCRECGELRKVGDFMTDDGEHVPPCVHCGDPEYYEVSLFDGPLVTREIGEGLDADALIPMMVDWHNLTMKDAQGPFRNGEKRPGRHE